MARKALLILSVLLLALSSASLVTLAQPTNSNSTEGPSAPPPGGGHPMGPCLIKYKTGHPCPTSEDPKSHSFGHQPPPPPVRQGITYHALQSGRPAGVPASGKPYTKCRYCTGCSYNC